MQQKIFNNLLTGQEYQILKLVVDGKKNKEIATILKLSDASIKTYISSLFQKMGVDNRVQMSVKAVQEKLV